MGAFVQEQLALLTMNQAIPYLSDLFFAFVKVSYYTDLDGLELYKPG